MILFISILPTHILAETGPVASAENELATKVASEELEEVESERDEFSKTYVDEEGNFTKEIYAEPIHTEIDGELTEISTDVKLDKAKGVLETESTQLEAVYPDEMSSEEEITYTFGNHNLEFSNITASDGSKEFSLDPDATTRVEENKVFYEKVLPGIDLRHVSLNNEVKEDWIINDYQGIHQFNYEVTTDLIAQLEADGSIGFYEDPNLEKKVFKLPAPVMEDSNINDALGHGVKSTDLRYELTSIGESKYAIRLVADKKWLESEERVFPVYIDPSVIIDALGDSYVSSATPDTNLNKQWNSVYGEYVLKVGKYDTSTGTNYAYIKFAIIGLLKGAIIDSASLQTYVTHTYSATEKTGLWVDRVNAPWAVDTITWNNKPSSTNIASTTVGRDQWAAFNVTPTIQGMADGTLDNNGFKFHTNGNGQTYWKQLSAAENANKTKIVVNYHFPTMKSPTITAAQYGDGQTTGYTNVSWPAIYGATSYELQMFNGKTFEKVYAGTGTSWTSKGKKIFPLAPHSTTSAYKLDGTGSELAVDPSKFYSAKSGVATTRKEYGFKVLAKYANGNSPLSLEVKKALPMDQIDTPNIPTVKASAYPETDTVNKGTGWLDISWEPVPGATGYRVLLYNGKTSEEFSVGNVTSWSTKGQKIWPTNAEIAAGRFTLHHDKSGAELAANPNPVYVNSGGYTNYKRYSVRVKAESSLGVTPPSDSQYGYIPLAVPKNVKVTSTEILDYVDYVGALNIQWDAVTDAGGYIINFFDGVKYQQIDVGKVTNWSTKGITLFNSVESDLPVDPTDDYLEANTTNLTALDRKAYVFNIQAYRHSEADSPDTVEKEKMEGYRGLSTKSTNIYATIPEEVIEFNEEIVSNSTILEVYENEVNQLPSQTEEELIESISTSQHAVNSSSDETIYYHFEEAPLNEGMVDYYGELEKQGTNIEDFIKEDMTLESEVSNNDTVDYYGELEEQDDVAVNFSMNSTKTVEPSNSATANATKVVNFVEVVGDTIYNPNDRTITIKQTITKILGQKPSYIITGSSLYRSNSLEGAYSKSTGFTTEWTGSEIYVGKTYTHKVKISSTNFYITTSKTVSGWRGSGTKTKTNKKPPVLANKIGLLYPRIKDPISHKWLPMPAKSNMAVVPSSERVKRDDASYRQNFMNYFEKTYGPYTGRKWSDYEIHHVTPLEYGGTHSLLNLFALRYHDHRYRLHGGNGWWKNYR